MMLVVFFIVAVISLFSFSQIIRAHNREKNISTSIYRNLRVTKKDLQSKFDELRSQYTKDAQPKKTWYGRPIKKDSWLDSLLRRK